MKTLGYRQLLKVTSLPTPSTALDGVMVELSTDSKPYYCNGSTWVDLTLTSGTTPGGSTGQIQYNNASAFAGATNVKIDNSDLLIAANSAPVTPAAGNVKIFGKTMAARVLPASVGPSGMDAALQPSIWRQKVGLFTPNGGSTTVSTIGMAAPTAVGTATSRSVATTNLLARTRRIGYVSAATAGSLAGLYQAVAQVTTGNGSNLGGFFCSIRFAFTDAAAVSGVRAFVGVQASAAAPTNVEANTLVNSIGVAQLSTDTTQLYLVYGGSAAQTAIALGTNFPPMAAAGATGGDMYDFTVFSPPSANGVVYYQLEKVGTTLVASGTLTPTTVGVQTPASTTFLGWRAWRSNNATALACGIDIISAYLETDY